jgi:hypothetical protein
MADCVHIEASPKAADFMFKAVKQVAEGHTESGERSETRGQNLATEHLFKVMDDSYKTFSDVLSKEVERILDSSSTTETSKEIQAE